MTIEAETITTAEDDRLLALLADSRGAEAAYLAALQADDDPGADAAMDELKGVLAAMADIPAAGWQGIAVKTARLCRSLNADPGGNSISYADVPLADSLAEDLARLAPEAMRAAG